MPRRPRAGKASDIFTAVCPQTHHWSVLLTDWGSPSQRSSPFSHSFVLLLLVIYFPLRSPLLSFWPANFLERRDKGPEQRAQETGHVSCGLSRWKPWFRRWYSHNYSESAAFRTICAAVSEMRSHTCGGKVTEGRRKPGRLVQEPRCPFVPLHDPLIPNLALSLELSQKVLSLHLRLTKQTMNGRAPSHQSCVCSCDSSVPLRRTSQKLGTVTSTVVGNTNLSLYDLRTLSDTGSCVRQIVAH